MVVVIYQIKWFKNFFSGNSRQVLTAKIALVLSYLSVTQHIDSRIVIVESNEYSITQWVAHSLAIIQENKNYFYWKLYTMEKYIHNG